MKKILKKGLIASSLVFAIVLWWATAHQNQATLKVYIFSVGQGDAIFVETPAGKQILIDGGPSQKILEKLGSVMGPTDSSIDLMILTHPHDDHVFGLVPVMERYQIGRLLYNGTAASNQNYNYLLELAKQKHTPADIVSSPGTINLEDNCRINFLYPLSDLSGQSLKNINSGSVVTQLDCLDHRFLFMGDLEKKGENELMATNINLKSEIIKLGHHGSNTSSGAEFLNKVSPALAVISVGSNNTYNLPSTSTIEMLDNSRMNYWRTDNDGNLLLEVKDGQIIKKSQ